MADEGVLVYYGRGADLGNLRFFADDLKTTELKSYAKDKIVQVNVERRNAFFHVLNTQNFGFKIKEFHIFSHSIGGGLYLGYGDPTLAQNRTAVMQRGKASYQAVLDAEAGAVLTDDLIRQPYVDYRAKIRTLFAAGARIKIWGCNSAVVNWIYGDPTASGASTADPNAAALYYYWRALNERNTPKPSIAQAFADYFQVPTFGADSGSSIQVLHKGKWIWAPQFLKLTKRKFVGEADVLRLAPDKGDYREYKPR